MLPPNINSQLRTQYQLSVITASKIPTGLINETYKIDAESGAFILQKLNPIFAPESIYDVDAISQYLKSQGMLTQKIIRTREGKLWLEDNGEVWRLMSYIPGQIFEKLETQKIAYEAGKILGQFHRALANFKYGFRHHRPMHHNTEKHFKLFLKAAGDSSSDAPVEIRMTNEIDALKNTILELPKLLLPKSLRKTITHGDPKVSNVIFNNPSQPPLNLRGGVMELRAIALIDLDDVGNHHSPLIELGDAFRSWCGNYEDDPGNSFDLEKFSAAFAGYQDGSKDFLIAEEKKLIPRAIKLITLELASRFLRDYFEDSYFGWSPKKYKSRREHNLARARGQVALYNDIVKKEREIASACSQ